MKNIGFPKEKLVSEATADHSLVRGQGSRVAEKLVLLVFLVL